MPERTRPTVIHCATCGDPRPVKSKGPIPNYCDNRTCWPSEDIDYDNFELPATRTCPCGNEFEPTRLNHRLCTPACGRIPPTPPERECDGCGEPFIPSKNDDRIRYCKPSHRELWRARQQPEQECPWCGQNFRDRYRNDKTYCSTDCATAARSVEANPFEEVPWKVCIECGRDFVHRRPAKYCGDACREKANAPAKRLRRCENCDQPFWQFGPGPNRRWCGEWCAHEARITPLELQTCKTCGTCYLAYSYQDYCSAACRPGNESVEPDKRLAVFKRDGYRCHLCGRKCRQDVSTNHQLAPTVDHLVPQDKGGSHAMRNLRTAHRKCNSAKGNRAANDQMLLFG